MRKYIFILIIITISSCVIDKEENGFAIAIHGGAGTILKENLTTEKEFLIRGKLEEAIQVGHDILKNEGTSIEAVVETIKILEDSPLFNAGKGAVFTANKTIEHDASIMDGSDLNAGATTSTTIVKNPITLAYEIMTKSEHVFLSGKGAEKFARQQNLKLVNSSYFETEFRLNALKQAKKNESVSDSIYKDEKFGTVGCVAIDKKGNLAAGTSTGGMTNKKWGRIGDSPIIGAGTYANNLTCAVSSTGWGEYFIRAMVAHDISALVQYKNLSLKESARLVIQEKLLKLGGDGGVIAIDNKANIVMEFNTPGMYRASINKKGELNVSIYN